MLYVVLRWITAVEALVLIGWALAVLQEAAKFRPPNLYVRCVAASYIALVIAAALHSIVDPRGEPHVFVLIRLLALSYGIAAMYVMWRHYRYSERVRRHGERSERQAERLRRDGGLD